MAGQRPAGVGDALDIAVRAFRRRDHGLTPATDANDDTAIAAITGPYETGLADLKRAVGNA